jgi:GAF domain-containing protein
MSIRMIARDLYRLQQEVDRLENQLQACSSAKREDLEDQLRKTRAERDRLKRMLEGSKEEPAYRKPK